mmetsp:Transcript_9166/g.20577  ORF Transcript_9166/g.20577 Transcript_9166/m.20577 type:complete len:215 (-) Transcript_9166:239-883(-)
MSSLATNVGLVVSHVGVVAVGLWYLNKRLKASSLRTLKVVVGTTNQCKVAAVQAAIQRYPDLAGASVVAVKVPSGVADQPKTMEETQLGARNRAQAAVKEIDGDVGLGIESGLFELSGAWYDVCFVALYNKAEGTLRYGLSCAFEIPPPAMERVRAGRDLTQACNDIGITDNPQLGEAGGLIGILSDGRVTRQAYTEQALESAFMPYRKSRWYG